MAEGLFIRGANSFVPDDDAARELMQGIPIGSIVSCKIARPRNLKHHRLYWALCSAIASSVGAQRENVSDVLKIKTGHFSVVQTKTERLRFPRSISFAKMDQAAFNKFFEECCRVICTEFLPDMKPSALRKEIETMVGIPEEEGTK